MVNTIEPIYPANNKPSFITLLTDFGLSDSYVGMMKGAILNVNPNAKIIDLTHDIAHQNLIQAAYVINASYSYFPENTVHIVVVDPGVGSNRKIIGLKKANHIFLAPDNGVLTLVMDEGNIDALIQVNNPDYFPGKISKTFHGRDIFAPVAGHISKGVDLVDTGPPIHSKDIKRLNIKGPSVSDNGELLGHIIYIDHFGNLITNIDSKTLERMSPLKETDDIIIELKNEKIFGISLTYESAGKKMPLAILGSSDFLEIALNCGNAKHYFKAESGDIVRLYAEKRFRTNLPWQNH